MFAENDIIAISSLGALRVMCKGEFEKLDHDFILVLHCNFTSIRHHFRYNELFMFAGIDVISISSPGGATGKF